MEDDLSKYGFAPGMYTITCATCGEQPWFCDKRAIRCEVCARTLRDAEMAKPKVEAKAEDLLEGWGVLQPDVEQVIKASKISALRDAQKAMNPTLRSMLSRGDAHRIIQKLIDNIEKI